jgi:hypothetical protein
MTTTELKRLRKKLPKQYGALIASNLQRKDIDNLKVVKVFNGEITNPEITLPVIEEAIRIVNAAKLLKSKLRKTLKAA